MSPVAVSSTGRPLCAECSDEVELDDDRTVTEAGVMHADCARERQAAA